MPRESSKVVQVCLRSCQRIFGYPLSSWRSISQRMPLASTNRMPVRAAQSSMRQAPFEIGQLFGQLCLDHLPQFTPTGHRHDRVSHTPTRSVNAFF